MSFIHFGCWNEGFCNKKTINNGMSAVMNELSNREAPSFYIVAGDNYYPKKIKYPDKSKIKIFNDENFRSGMNCLMHLKEKAQVFMLMGNHDLVAENNLFLNIDENEARKVHPNEEKKGDMCTIIKKELGYTNDFNIYEHSIIIPESKTVCLFINSVLYSGDLTEDRDIACLKEFKPNDYKSFTKLAQIIDYEETQLFNLLDQILDKWEIRNLVVAGHDPIVTARHKKSKGLTYTPLMKRGLQFLKELYDKVPQAHKYYLCADTHQYQMASIILGDNEITQHVVGTGGTECDDEEIKINTEYVAINNSTVKYKLLETNRSFGYLYCNKEEGTDNISCVFYPVAGCNAFSGEAEGHGASADVTEARGESKQSSTASNNGGSRISRKRKKNELEKNHAENVKLNQSFNSILKINCYLPT